MNYPYAPDPGFAALLKALAEAEVRRKVFISYHHGGDQSYYDQLSLAAHDQFKLCFDNSLERRIDSDDPKYVMQRIRDKCIVGTSVTVVLCGLETPWRKYVDWEIKATLDKGHGLLAVMLPSNTLREGYRWVPQRLYDNLGTGRARWVEWADFTRDAASFKTSIEAARTAKGETVNHQPMMSRNQPYPFFRVPTLGELLVQFAKSR
jgi:hypothetical protein